jgi:hypothetical protein
MTGNSKIDVVLFVLLAVITAVDHALAASPKFRANATAQLLFHFVDGGLKAVKVQPSGIVENLVSKIAEPVIEKGVQAALEPAPAGTAAEQPKAEVKPAEEEHNSINLS